MQQKALALAARSISKSYGSARVLNDVSLNLYYGEIHALIGANGSGKSTFIRVVTGVERADGGRLSVLPYEPPFYADGLGAEDGLPPGSKSAHGRGSDQTSGASARQGSWHGGGRYKNRWVPGEARRRQTRTQDAALVVFHQDLVLAPNLTVQEMFADANALVTRRRHFFLDWPQVRRHLRASIDQFGEFNVSADAVVGKLGNVEQGIVACARVLHSGLAGREILVLDEPTSYLPSAVASRLLAMISRFRDSGAAILLVTHHLPDVLEVADVVSVFADGRCIAARRPADGEDERSLAELAFGTGQVLAAIGTDGQRPITQVTGGPGTLGVASDTKEGCARRRDALDRCRDVLQGNDAGGTPAGAERRIALSARELTRPGVVSGSLDAYEGEVLGLLGLPGSGALEYAYLLGGQRLSASGRVRVGDEPERQQASDQRARSNIVGGGVFFLPAGRGRDVGVLSASIRDNLMAGLVSGAVVRRPRELEMCEEALRRVGLWPIDLDRPLGSLSGGMQQRVLFARSFVGAFRVLVLVEPTTGVDMAARAAIVASIKEQVRRGVSVILAATEFDEIWDVFDRVAVFWRGSVGAIYDARHVELVDVLAWVGRSGGPGPQASAEGIT